MRFRLQPQSPERANTREAQLQEAGSNPDRPNQRKRGFNMGGFVTDETGKVVMHISSPDILTQESIDFWEKEYGIELRCDICNVRLQPGDQKDHCWAKGRIKKHTGSGIRPILARTEGNKVA